VGVVGHEAVRNWRELFVGGGTQDLRHHEIHNRRGREEAPARMTTERQEITKQTDVVECAEVTGSMRRHNGRKAIRDPRPAKAGRYDGRTLRQPG